MRFLRITVKDKDKTRMVIPFDKINYLIINESYQIITIGFGPNNAILDIEPLPLNLIKPADVPSLMNKIKELGGRIDYLISTYVSAESKDKEGTFKFPDGKQWQKSIEKEDEKDEGSN